MTVANTLVAAADSISSDTAAAAAAVTPRQRDAHAYKCRYIPRDIDHIRERQNVQGRRSARIARCDIVCVQYAAVGLTKIARWGRGRELCCRRSDSGRCERGGGRTLLCTCVCRARDSPNPDQAPINHLQVLRLPLRKSKRLLHFVGRIPVRLPVCLTNVTQSFPPFCIAPTEKRGGSDTGKGPASLAAFKHTQHSRTYCSGQQVWGYSHFMRRSDQARGRQKHLWTDAPHL